MMLTPSVGPRAYAVHPDTELGACPLWDMCTAKRNVRFTPNSDRESEIPQKAMSALARKRTSYYVRMK
jgi:hypothetical protein